MAEEKSQSSTKRLVKILVIVGIGVPVLVELMTLFNLIDSQMFGGDENEIQQQEQAAEVREISQGDSLFKDQASPVIIDTLRVDVRGRDWRFKLGLRAVDSVRQETFQLQVDSLKLQSDKIMSSEDASFWQVVEEVPAGVYGSWDLPDGDIPTALYLSSWQAVDSDSLTHIQQEVPLDKIPVRYGQ